MISIKSMALLLLVLLSLFASQGTASPLYYICESTTGNFSRSSTYSFNLNQLLTNLYDNASGTGSFATSITGSIPDRIYGRFLSRGDIQVDVWTLCFSAASSDIKLLCPMNKGATIWYDFCQLRYSNQDILHAPDVSLNIIGFMYNSTQNVSADQLLRFEFLTTVLMGNLSDLAVRDTSRLFATGETVLTAGNTSIYGLVQCGLDLSVGDCRTCLQDTVDQITNDPLKGKVGGRTFGLWCNMRFQTYKFYKGNSMLTAQPPSPTNVSSTPNVIHPPTGSSYKDKRTKIRGVEIFLPLGILFLMTPIICLIWMRIWMRKRRDKGTIKSQNDQMPLTQGTDLASKLKVRESNLEISLIPFSSIVEATSNFSEANKLGQGGFGSVYKGQLLEGESIAVKRLDAFSGQGLEEFMNEIRVIAKLQHQNLVKLLGCCIEGDEKLLIYEYMPNNSLDYHLFDPIRKEQLDWSNRLSIIDGIAQGLLYLHKYSRVRIIHRDLKASNILLDPNMNPKISDFGMARIFDANTTQANTKRIVGTYGYMSPEYAMEGLFSVKSDVFSFGVLLLEIISGKRNTTFHKSGKALNLLAYAWQLWKSGNWLDFVDPSLGDKILTNDISKCIIVALMCVQENAVDRPIMSEIITMLGSENTVFPDPKKPAFFTTGNEGASKLPINELASQNDITYTTLEGR